MVGGPLVGAPRFALPERNSRGSIVVKMSGKRFMIESMPYVDAFHTRTAAYTAGPGENTPVWLVFDQRYRDRYVFAATEPRRDEPRALLRGQDGAGRPRH